MGSEGGGRAINDFLLGLYILSNPHCQTLMGYCTRTSLCIHKSHKLLFPPTPNVIMSMLPIIGAPLSASSQLHVLGQGPVLIPKMVVSLD